MLEIALLAAALGVYVKLRGAWQARAGPVRRPKRPWQLPPSTMLRSTPSGLESDLAAYATRLVAGLSARGLHVRHAGTVVGPTVVRYELDLGDARVSSLTNRAADIAYLLGAERPGILSPVDGRSVVGIEVPRRTRETVRLASVLASERLRALDVGIGLTTDGAPIVANLSALPHLLIAGATGAGKSVFINSLIVSLLMGATPADLQLLLIDPKRVELAQYRGLPHLLRPIVTEGGDAIGALLAAVDEMDKRYKHLERLKVRNISEANAKGAKMPYLVIIVDEMADLMMAAREYVEPAIVRIAQLGRAAGVHLVLATQRPSVDVITGLIKANVPARAAFAVTSHTDSRVILGYNGAETLTGKGDMLWSDGGHKLSRAQSALVTDDEIGKVVRWWKSQK